MVRLPQILRNSFFRLLLVVALFCGMISNSWAAANEYPLHESAERGDVEEVKRLLEALDYDYGACLSSQGTLAQVSNIEDYSKLYATFKELTYHACIHGSKTLKQNVLKVISALIENQSDQNIWSTSNLHLAKTLFEVLKNMDHPLKDLKDLDHGQRIAAVHNLLTSKGVNCPEWCKQVVEIDYRVAADRSLESIDIILGHMKAAQNWNVVQAGLHGLADIACCTLDKALLQQILFVSERGVDGLVNYLYYNRYRTGIQSWKIRALCFRLLAYVSIMVESRKDSRFQGAVSQLQQILLSYFFQEKSKHFIRNVLPEGMDINQIGPHLRNFFIRLLPEYKNVVAQEYVRLQAQIIELEELLTSGAYHEEHEVARAQESLKKLKKGCEVFERNAEVLSRIFEGSKVMLKPDMPTVFLRTAFEQFQNRLEHMHKLEQSAYSTYIEKQYESAYAMLSQAVAQYKELHSYPLHTYVKDCALLHKLEKIIGTQEPCKCFDDMDQYSGGSIARRRQDENPFLMHAKTFGDVESVEAFFEMCPERIEDGELLHEIMLNAVKKNHVEVVRFLLEGFSESIDINRQMMFNYTYLAYAVAGNNPRIVELLCEHGAETHCREEGGATLLHKASARGYNEIVLYLLKRGIDPNEITEFGSTALHYAAAKGREETVYHLKLNGADPTIKNGKGKTSAQLLAEYHKNNSQYYVEGALNGNTCGENEKMMLLTDST